MVAGWISATGPDFKFSLKIPKTITHDRRLVGIEKELLDFVDLVQPFVKAGKMGCLLAQLPPTFAFKKMINLESLFKLLPRNMHFAVEFRHESWNRKETWSLLKKYNVANTVADSPIEFLTKPVITASTHSYIRWHGRGRPTLYDYTYSELELCPWLDKLEGMEREVPLVYAYFNNTGAPVNLLQMLDMRGEMTDAQKKAKARAERYSRKMDVKKITDF